MKLFSHPEYRNAIAVNITFNPLHLASQKEYEKLMKNDEKIGFEVKTAEEYNATFIENINEIVTFQDAFMFYIDRSCSTEAIV